GAQMFTHAVQGGRQQRAHAALLGGEVAPQGASGHADGLGDVVAGGRGDPLFGEQGDRGASDLFAYEGLAPLAHGRAPPPGVLTCAHGARCLTHVPPLFEHCSVAFRLEEWCSAGGQEKYMSLNDKMSRSVKNCTLRGTRWFAAPTQEETVHAHGA